MGRGPSHLPMTHECFCGAEIKEVAPGVWIDAYDRNLCYPESKNPVDASAPHEPIEELVKD